MPAPAVPSSPAGAPDPPATRPTRSRLLLAVVVLLVAAAALVLALAAGRADSALLYVGVPCLVALGVGLLPSQGFGTICQAVTVLLLLASALLHEGAVCVLLVSPLVYGVAGLGYWVATGVRRGDQRHAVVAPLLVLVALEGVVPGARVDPDQQARAERTTAADCRSFEAALVRGPRPRPEDRGWLLRTSGYPSPTRATGEGVDVGDTWELDFVAGRVETVVAAADTTAATDATGPGADGSARGRLVFEVTEDTSKTARSVDLARGTITWAPDPDDPARCRTALVLDYTRKLDPSLWFGPITAAFMDRGAETFLRGLD